MAASGRRTAKLLLDTATQAARSQAMDRSTALRFGVIDSVDSVAGTVDVIVAGVTLYDIPCMGAPTAGDPAWLLHQGSSMVCIGPTGLGSGGGGGGGGGGGLVPIWTDTITGVTTSGFSLPDGTFDDQYDNYEIHLDWIGSGSGTYPVAAQLRSGGVDDGSSQYSFTFGRNYTNSAVDAYGQDTTSWQMGHISGPSGQTTSMVLRVHQPHKASTTQFMADTGLEWTSGAGIRGLSGGTFGANTVFDSMTIWPTSGTFDVVVTVYGYAKTIPSGGGTGGETEGAIDSITGGGTLTDDGTYYYLTFDTPGSHFVDVALVSGDFALLDAYAWGAGGGSCGSGRDGGGGAFKKATCKVRDGSYCVVVGGGGNHRTSGAGPGTRPAGFGGLAGNVGYGGQGGGLSGFFRTLVSLASAILIAGAGGGGGWDSSGQYGGPGGDTSGSNGGGGEAGAGATLAGPGSGPYGTTQPSGAGLQGGDPAGHADGGGGGGGGAGAFGGGAGGNGSGGGGGGGCSHANDECTGVTGDPGSGATAGGTSEALYASGVGTGGSLGSDGGPGRVVLVWEM